jgi:alginate O-acetyltransferase complex protein AlgI
LLFSSPDYPLFLGAVFLLYGVARSQGHLGAAARIALMLVLADTIFLLVSKRPQTLWDPVGGVVLTLLAENTAALPPWWHYALGTAVLALGVAVGQRHGHAIADARVQRRLAHGLAGSCLGIGASVAIASAMGDLAVLSAGFADLGHLAYLWMVALAIGASLTQSARSIAALLILFAASSLFYLAWCVAMHGAYRYLLALLLATIALDYYLGLAIERSESPARRRSLLVLSVISNLGVLAVFKYADFFLIDVLRLPMQPLALILPAGISFHTFQSLSYTIDVYRKEVPATRSILEFATFVLFFPQLVAGPIVRARDLLPQLAALPAFDHQRAVAGLFRIAIGLWKKIALADTLALTIVDPVFSAPERFSSVEVAAAVVGYGFQIYLDFSAYSDIALGSAQILGFEMPENFRTPYRSATLQEFWRRWHMSLSTWLRDYLYIPLGGSRGSEFATYRNLLLTMLLGGLWHGASWTFIVWGLLHGGGLAMSRLLQERVAAGAAALRRALQQTVAIAAIGAGAHCAIGALHGWADLALSWLYLTPLWAALSVVLSSRAASRPWRRIAVSSCHRRFARLCRWTMVALAVGLLLALRFDASALWAPVVALILVTATAAASLDAGIELSWHNAHSGLCRGAATSLVALYVLVAWVFFRATSFANALDIFRRIAALEWDHANVSPLVVVSLAAAAASHLFPDRTFAWLRERFMSLTPLSTGLVLAAVALVLRELAHPHIVPFIYFQF